MGLETLSVLMDVLILADAGETDTMPPENNCLCSSVPWDHGYQVLRMRH